MTLVPRYTTQGRALQPGTRTAVRVDVEPNFQGKNNSKTTAKMLNKKRKSITAIPVGSGGDGTEKDDASDDSLQHFAVISYWLDCKGQCDCG